MAASDARLRASLFISAKAVRINTAHHFFLPIARSTSRSFRLSSKLSALSSTRFPDAATVAAISRAASILRSVRNDGLFWMASPSSCALFASPAHASRLRERSAQVHAPRARRTLRPDDGALLVLLRFLDLRDG